MSIKPNKDARDAPVHFTVEEELKTAFEEVVRKRKLKMTPVFQTFMREYVARYAAATDDPRAIDDLDTADLDRDQLKKLKLALAAIRCPDRSLPLAGLDALLDLAAEHRDSYLAPHNGAERLTRK